MNNYIFLTKFIEQKCLGYNHYLNKSEWFAKAKFSDGSIRTWRGFLKTFENFPLYRGWF